MIQSIRRAKSGAFLQGYDEHSGWALIEFWQDDFGDFVAILEKEVTHLLNPPA